MEDTTTLDMNFNMSLIPVADFRHNLLDDRFRQNASLHNIFNFSIDKLLEVLRPEEMVRNVGPQAEAVLIAIYVVLMLTGLAANALVAFVVARRAAMRTPRNLYIANLTASDLSLCVVCMPFTLVSILRRTWTLGALLCKLVPALQGTNIMVSVGTITAIALDRYFTIVRRPGVREVDGRRRVVLSIFLIWFFATVATLPIFFFQVVEPVTFQLPDQTTAHEVVLYEACIERWPSQDLKLAYTVSLLLLQSVMPALVLGIVHARIARYLHAHARSAADSNRARRELRRNRRTTLLLSGVAVLFIVSWLPLGTYQVVVDLLFAHTSPTSQYIALAACHVTAMSSAVSNPIVYGWLNSNMRREFVLLLPECCKIGLGNLAEQSAVPTTALEDATTRTQLQNNCQNHKDNVSLVATNPTKPTTTVMVPKGTLVTAL